MCNFLSDLLFFGRQVIVEVLWGLIFWWSWFGWGSLLFWQLFGRRTKKNLYVVVLSLFFWSFLYRWRLRRNILRLITFGMR
jgi:hypothetical protein